MHLVLHLHLLFSHLSIDLHLLLLLFKLLLLLLLLLFPDPSFISFNHSLFLCNRCSSVEFHDSREVKQLVLESSLSKNIKFLIKFLSTIAAINNKAIVTFCKLITIKFNEFQGSICKEIAELLLSSLQCNLCCFKEALKHSLLYIVMLEKQPFSNM